MKKLSFVLTFFSIFFLVFLSGCIVIEESQYGDPIYQEPRIIYKVWPRTAPLYYYHNNTYIYQPQVGNKPRKPRPKPNHPRKPHKPRNPRVKNVRSPR